MEFFPVCKGGLTARSPVNVGITRKVYTFIHLLLQLITQIWIYTCWRDIKYIYIFSIPFTVRVSHEQKKPREIPYHAYRQKWCLLRKIQW